MEKMKKLLIGSFVAIVLIAAIVIGVTVGISKNGGSDEDRFSVPPSDNELIFGGIFDGYSFQKGIIEIDWNPPFLTSTSPGQENVDADDLVYDVFVAVGEYNFTAARLEFSVPELIHIFENGAAICEGGFEGQPDQYIEVPGDQQGLSVNSTCYGELHTILVTARLDRLVSNNAAGTNIVVASVDPQLQPDINLVGIFIPTKHVDILLEDVDNVTIDHNGQVQKLSFVGAVSLEAQGLEAGDYVTGFASDLKAFSSQVIEVLPTSNYSERVELYIGFARIEMLFSELELDARLGNTQEEELDNATRLRSRRLGFLGGLSRRIRDGYENVRKGFERARDWIGDRLEGVDKALEEFAALIDTEGKEDFTLIDHDQNFTTEIIPDTLDLYTELSIESKIHVYARIKFGVPTNLMASISATYMLGAKLQFYYEFKEQFAEIYPIWTGFRSSTWFMVGPVPVEVYWHPRLDLELTMDAAVSIPVELGGNGSASSEVGAAFNVDRNPRFRAQFVPPVPDIGYYFTAANSTLSVDAAAALQLVFEVGIYQGLLSASPSLETAITMKARGTYMDKHNIGPVIETFDIDLVFSIPFKASALYNTEELSDAVIFSKRFPLLTLPKAELCLNDEESDLDNSETEAVLRVVRARKIYPSIPDEIILKNGFAGPPKWYLDSPSEVGWYVKDIRSLGGDFTEVVLESTGTGTLPPEGNVTFAVLTELPSFNFFEIVESIPLVAVVNEELVGCIPRDNGSNSQADGDNNTSSGGNGESIDQEGSNVVVVVGGGGDDGNQNNSTSACDCLFYPGEYENSMIENVGDATVETVLRWVLFEDGFSSNFTAQVASTVVLPPEAGGEIVETAFAGGCQINFATPPIANQEDGDCEVLSVTYSVSGCTGDFEITDLGVPQEIFTVTFLDAGWTGTLPRMALVDDCQCLEYEDEFGVSARLCRSGSTSGS